MSAIVLCIGPMVAIPRTAATTFELSIAPLTGGISAVVFSVLFFLVIFLLCIRESAVVDIVGKVLTPLLLVGLLVLIIKGAVDPLGPLSAAAQTANIPGTGIKAGYQTMDVLAAMLFGILILRSAENKGYREPKAKTRVVAGAGIVAGAALLVVYLGLTYLGASVSSLFDAGISRSALVLSIVESLLGRTGLVVFAIVVALACITTAVALVSASADYFSNLSGKRLSYPVLVIAICVFSAVVSNVGLDQLFAIASPILDIVYPPALVLIVLSFLRRGISPLVYRLATVGALITSSLGVLATYTSLSLPVLDYLPFASLGFGWVMPAAVCGMIGLLLSRRGGGHTSPEKNPAWKENEQPDA